MNGQTPHRDCISGSLIQLQVGSATRCNWIHAGASKAKNDQGPNLQHAPAGFSGATTAFISVLSDPNKRSELFSEGRGFFDSILLQMNCPSKGKGTGSEGGGEGADAEGRCCHCLALAKQPLLQTLMGWEERVVSSPCHSHSTKMLCWLLLVLIYWSSFRLKGVL